MKINIRGKKIKSISNTKKKKKKITYQPSSMKRKKHVQRNVEHTRVHS